MNNNNNNNNEGLPPIVDNEKEGRFEMIFENGEMAYLEYTNHKEIEYSLDHTFVPNSQRGKNIGSLLSTAAMNKVKDSNKMATLPCSYISDHWLPKNPQYMKYVIKSIKK
ncbi:hypothetical protein RB653_003691 [Dictyostelium firmibasis]|uniref:N-acetyltransferase domain-containing protein n=1 Tax=Dictyostelium firmibasis TaxID=79012 RepID=A0AAN7UHX7_9MYCE